MLCTYCHVVLWQSHSFTHAFHFRSFPHRTSSTCSSPGESTMTSLHSFPTCTVLEVRICLTCFLWYTHTHTHTHICMHTHNVFVCIYIAWQKAQSSVTSGHPSHLSRCSDSSIPVANETVGCHGSCSGNVRGTSDQSVTDTSKLLADNVDESSKLDTRSNQPNGEPPTSQTVQDSLTPAKVQFLPSSFLNAAFWWALHLLNSSSRKRLFLWLELFEYRYVPNLYHLGNGNWFLISQACPHLLPGSSLICPYWLPYHSCTLRTHNLIVTCENYASVWSSVSIETQTWACILVEMFLRTVAGMNVSITSLQ